MSLFLLSFSRLLPGRFSFLCLFCGRPSPSPCPAPRLVSLSFWRVRALPVLAGARLFCFFCLLPCRFSLFFLFSCLLVLFSLAQWFSSVGLSLLSPCLSLPLSLAFPPLPRGFWVLPSPGWLFVFSACFAFFFLWVVPARSSLPAALGRSPLRLFRSCFPFSSAPSAPVPGSLLLFPSPRRAYCPPIPLFCGVVSSAPLPAGPWVAFACLAPLRGLPLRFLVFLVLAPFRGAFGSSCGGCLFASLPLPRCCCGCGVRLAPAFGAPGCLGSGRWHGGLLPSAGFFAVSFRWSSAAAARCGVLARLLWRSLWLAARLCFLRLGSRGAFAGWHACFAFARSLLSVLPAFCAAPPFRCLLTVSRVLRPRSCPAPPSRFLPARLSLRCRALASAPSAHSRAPVFRRSAWGFCPRAPGRSPAAASPPCLPAAPFLCLSGLPVPAVSRWARLYLGVLPPSATSSWPASSPAVGPLCSCLLPRRLSLWPCSRSRRHPTRVPSFSLSLPLASLVLVLLLSLVIASPLPAPVRLIACPPQSPVALPLPGACWLPRTVFPRLLLPPGPRLSMRPRSLLHIAVVVAPTPSPPAAPVCPPRPRSRARPPPLLARCRAASVVSTAAGCPKRLSTLIAANRLPPTGPRALLVPLCIPCVTRPAPPPAPPSSAVCSVFSSWLASPSSFHAFRHYFRVLGLILGFP